MLDLLFPCLSTGGARQPDAGGRQHRVSRSPSHHAPRLLGRSHHLPHPQTPEDEQVRVRLDSAGLRLLRVVSQVQIMASIRVTTL